MAEYCDEFVLEEALNGEFPMEQVVTANGLPKGGTTDQFLKKKSSTDFDAEWSDIGAGDVGYSSETTYAAGTVGSKIGELTSEINNPMTGLDTKAPVFTSTASGSIAIFEDGAAEMTIRGLSVNISDEDGCSECKIYNAAKGQNILYNPQWERSKLIASDGSISTNSSYAYTANYYPCAPGSVLTLQFYKTGTGVGCQIAFYEKDKTFIERKIAINGGETVSGLNYGTVTVPDNAYYFRANFPQAKTSNVMAEVGESPSEYKAATDYLAADILFPTPPGFVQTGTIHISSNGQAVLSSGESSYPLSGIYIIKIKSGTNNIWADCGIVSITYPADSNLYIEKKLSEPNFFDVSRDIFKDTVTANSFGNMKMY